MESKRACALPVAFGDNLRLATRPGGQMYTSVAGRRTSGVRPVAAGIETARKRSSVTASDEPVSQRAASYPLGRGSEPRLFGSGTEGANLAAFPRACRRGAQLYRRERDCAADIRRPLAIRSRQTPPCRPRSRTNRRSRQPGKGAGYSRWHHVRHGLQRHGLGRTGSSGSIENYGGLPQHDEFRPCVAWRLKPATCARVSRHHKSSTRLPDRVRVRIEAYGRPSAQANRLVVSPASAVHRPFFDAGSSSIRAFACQEACVCAFITVCPAIR